MPPKKSAPVSILPLVSGLKFEGCVESPFEFVATGKNLDRGDLGCATTCAGEKIRGRILRRDSSAIRCRLSGAFAPDQSCDIGLKSGKQWVYRKQTKTCPAVAAPAAEVLPGPVSLRKKAPPASETGKRSRTRFVSRAAPTPPSATAGETLMMRSRGKTAPPALAPAAAFGGKALDIKRKMPAEMRGQRQPLTVSPDAVSGEGGDIGGTGRTTVRTGFLKLTGRGLDGEAEAAAAEASFDPLRFRAGRLKLTGRGREGEAEAAAAEAAFDAVRFRTGQLRLTGNEPEREPEGSAAVPRPQGFRTGLLRLTGRGREGEAEAAAAEAAFDPVRFRTGLLKLTGRGLEGEAEAAAADAAFDPVRFRTGQLKLTGQFEE